MTDASPLPDCLALRIGLAARQLPDTTAGQLLRVLVAVLGEPLTETKLNSLKVRDLKTGADGALEEIDGAVLRLALHFLHGEEEAATQTAVPVPRADDDGPLPHSIQIACASNNGRAPGRSFRLLRPVSDLPGFGDRGAVDRGASSPSCYPTQRGP